ncbi:MAG: rod shape-determining protein MreC [Bacillota bacterium]|nr:rod shape-determining protein MreC [Bacillota bacterium]
MKQKNRFQKIIVVITIFVLILVTGLTFGGRENITKFENLLGKIIMPVQKTFVFTSGLVESVFDPIFNIWENKRMIDEVEKENQTLRKQLVEMSLDANEYSELKSLQNVFDFIDYDFDDYLVDTMVISKDPGNWFNMFDIDRGLKDGIYKNSVVINGDGLIGLVYEVGDDWAKVISIIDNKSSIGMKIVNPDRSYEGIINGGIDGNLRGYLFDPKAEVFVGDLIITSGKGLYPEGIIIGKIKDICKDSDKLLTDIMVEPIVNFKKMNRVLVLPKINNRKEVE